MTSNGKGNKLYNATYLFIC